MDAPLDAGAILAAVGGVAYEWTIADDRIRWGAGAAEVLGVPSVEAIATGRDFASLLDPASTTSRHDAILNSSGADDGAGVAYEVQYTLLPDRGRGKQAPDHRGCRPLVCRRERAGRRGRAASCGSSTSGHEREQRLAFLSRYDELTGFFNRSHLLAVLGEAIAEAKRLRTSIAFLIVAVDNFRAINEAYGFDTADQVFAAVGRRIKAELREGDAIGRYSGNKLGIVLMNCSESDMHAAAERFHAVVRQRHHHHRDERGRGDRVDRRRQPAAPRAHRARGDGAGAGGAAPGAQARLRPLRRLCPLARAAKRASAANAALSSELVAALNDKRLKLSFQPVVDVAVARGWSSTKACCASSGRTARSPLADDFIELCESLGLIRLIDHYVLGAHAGGAGGGAGGAHLGQHLGRDGGRCGVAVAARRGRRPPAGPVAGRLIVEITETAVIRNLDEAASFVATLHDLGCQLALDDFGAGFSSFRSLRALEVDIVKIAGVVPRGPAEQPRRSGVRPGAGRPSRATSA